MTVQTIYLAFWNHNKERCLLMFELGNQSNELICHTDKYWNFTIKYDTMNWTKLTWLIIPVVCSFDIYQRMFTLVTKQKPVSYIWFKWKFLFGNNKFNLFYLTWIYGLSTLRRIKAHTSAGIWKISVKLTFTFLYLWQ